MNSDPNFETLVAELKGDLPSERDSARLRTRLAALGIAAAQGVAGSAVAATAAASTTASTAVASATAGAAQASLAAVVVKTFAVALVAGTGVTSAAWYVARAGSQTEPAASVAAGVAPRKAGRSALPALPTAPGVEHFERAEGGEREPVSAAHEAARAAVPPALDPAELDLSAPGPAAPRAEARGTAPSRPAASLERATPLASTAAPLPAAASADGSRSTAAFSEPEPTAASAPAASAAVAPHPSAVATSAVEATTLREETALIDRALSALRASDAVRAERLLNQHRTRFPDGLLKQERERAERKLAELKSGQGAP